MTDHPIHRSPTRGRRSSLLAGAFLAATSALTVGCLDRPVVPQKPTTSNVFVEQVINTAIDAIDLLFVIDNSVSMADKQAILRDAVPLMVGRLVTPDCVNDAGDRMPNDGQDCKSLGSGYAPEFSPVDDIHIGVITSSIGGFGSESCQADQQQDKSLLIPKVRTMTPTTMVPVPNPTGQGFLSWLGGDTAAVNALQADFALQVEAAGESGCGFEASLEAWYRFLVDPKPPENIMLDMVTAVSTGIDQGILTQRAEFLRPTSLVAIVVLTDENDCSAMEGGNFYANAGFGWLIADRNRTFPIASAACEMNPNDQCCHSCLQPPPDGCTNTCGDSPPLATELDRANVRCFDNKRRFGVDLLYPTQRYVDGLSKSQIYNTRDNSPNENLVPNPLLVGRQPDLVFFAGIVGVPWQDIATPETRGESVNDLAFLTADDLRAPDDMLNGLDRWSLILGEPGLSRDAPECRGSAPSADCFKEPVPPSDPFMIESIAPRTGVHPITGDSIIQQGGNGWSPINGHEYDNSVPLSDSLPANDDLQYSCIFPLDAAAQKTNCTVDDFACDCADEPSKNRPLCKPTPSASAMADTTQRYGKAYPATRILRVLRDFGENSIVGSICPKILDDKTHPAFGYNPAVNAIVDRLAEKLGGQCLPRELSVDAEGRVPCTVVEAVNAPLTCAAANGREIVNPKIEPAVRKQLEATGRCGANSTTDCADYKMCAIVQHTGTDEDVCFSSTLAASQKPGFCYIDPAKGPTAGGFPVNPADTSQCLNGDPASWGSCTNPNVSGCSATQRRILRFVGDNTPVANSITFVACVGEAATEGGGQLPELPM